MNIRASAAFLLAFASLPLPVFAQSADLKGYYRFPAIGPDRLVFTAEGDLWSVALAGGVASRLTTHPGEETRAVLSADGTTLAFAATYEGPTEVYTMPLAGGLPTRRTYEGGRALPVTFDPAGALVYSTRRYSTLPATQLVSIDLASHDLSRVPLAQAVDGVHGPDGSLFFTRVAQGSFTKRYKGGTARQLWKFPPPQTGAAREASKLFPDYDGESTAPMWWNGRVYFITDRDGTMNVWSCDAGGGDLCQHTKHVGIDAASPSLRDGKIAYQLGPDIYLLDIASGKTAAVSITLASDFDQTREKWVKKPAEYMTSAHLSPSGDRVVMTARGQVFVTPRHLNRGGRTIEATRGAGVRYRDARFMPDGKTLLVLSDQSSEPNTPGEVEFWTLNADGSGAAKKLTSDAEVLRWEGVPSPDGNFIAHHDKHFRLFVLDVKAGVSTKVDESTVENIEGLAWSRDSAHLAYAVVAPNTYRQVKVYSVSSKATVVLTSDRFDSYAPVWSPDGEWMYFISDRNFETVVGSPWGTLAPEPYFDKRSKLMAVALKPGLRSPFDRTDELVQAKDEAKKEEVKKEEPKPDTKPETPGEAGKEEAKKDEAKPGAGEAKEEGKKDDAKKDEKKDAPKPIEIDANGIQERLIDVPVPPGNYSGLFATEKRLFWRSSGSGDDAKTSLMALDIDADALKKREFEAKAIVADIGSAEPSADGKLVLVRKGDALYVIDAGSGPGADLSKAGVDLSGWQFAMTPREEWRQMFVEAWRLERDYFYDRRMHGVDWRAMLDKYMPMVDRVSTREELSDVIAQMVAELSALHIFVRGGDTRRGPDDVQPASLGATFTRDPGAGGFRIERMFISDPDEPSRTGPLLMPGMDIKVGDVVTKVNDVDALSAPDIHALLRNQAGKQVLIEVKHAGGQTRKHIVTPISMGSEGDLRYDQWEYQRRKIVDESSNSTIGYVHLRSMGSGDMADWARHFYPVFQRQGLIIDVRNNRGGNIDSWILSRLLRKAWFFWQGRAGEPYWNMQYAFRGHMVLLCDELSASDGEAISEGFRRLGLGKVIGTRTWGGEIWLSSSNFLVDRGIATAAEFGVYGPEGAWLIEGRGVEPDIEVDNPPHETFNGEDRQLKAAIEHLQGLIREDPRAVTPVPAHPDKSSGDNKKK
ncbi:MAG: PD40 domain-containing protein [Phycisphaerae bacterium]|nr:PD40 domain-containing protein [Phycisphaerae bacterium]